MDKLIKYLGGGLLVACIVFFFAVFNGTILWMIYPHIHSLFAFNTILANKLSWWDSVCITWIFSILIKSSSSSNSKE